MFHFFVDEDRINEEYITITGADYNHMKNVIRLKIGDEVLVSKKSANNSNGSCDDEAVTNTGNYMCKVGEYTEDTAILTIIDSNVASNELPVKVTLFQGLPKVDKLELIIQKCVELGVYDIVPVAMKNCVVKLDDKKSASKLTRWNAISESAAKQSKRSIIPEVKDVLTYKQAVNLMKDYDVCLVPYENEAGMAATREIIGNIKAGSRVAIFIGPEGGFADEEIKLAKENNMYTITLGKRILRTETAGMATLAMIAYALEN